MMTGSLKTAGHHYFVAFKKGKGGDLISIYETDMHNHFQEK